MSMLLNNTKREICNVYQSFFTMLFNNNIIIISTLYLPTYLLTYLEYLPYDARQQHLLDPFSILSSLLCIDFLSQTFLTFFSFTLQFFFSTKSIFALLMSLINHFDCFIEIYEESLQLKGI